MRKKQQHFPVPSLGFIFTCVLPFPGWTGVAGGPSGDARVSPPQTRPSSCGS